MNTKFCIHTNTYTLEAKTLIDVVLTEYQNLDSSYFGAMTMIDVNGEIVIVDTQNKYVTTCKGWNKSDAQKNGINWIVSNIKKLVNCGREYKPIEIDYTTVSDKIVCTDGVRHSYSLSDVNVLCLALKGNIAKLSNFPSSVLDKMIGHPNDPITSELNTTLRIEVDKLKDEYDKAREALTADEAIETAKIHKTYETKHHELTDCIVKKLCSVYEKCGISPAHSYIDILRCENEY